jgi:hypothetical protein
MNDEGETPRTPADQLIGSLFAAAELARLSDEPAHDEKAALRQFNAWLDASTDPPRAVPQQPGQSAENEPGESREE